MENFNNYLCKLLYKMNLRFKCLLTKFKSLHFHCAAEMTERKAAANTFSLGKKILLKPGTRHYLKYF